MKIDSKLAVCLILMSFLVARSEFIPNQEPYNINTPEAQLKINIVPQLSTPIPSWIRQSLYDKVAGDYYRSPFNAPRSAINSNEKEFIWNLLLSNIKTAYYDSVLIDNIGIYEYKLRNEEYPRRDFFLRYSEADTIYVISGWSDKFISFYRAVPGIHKYDLKDLNKKLMELSKIDIAIPKNIFENCIKSNPYFIEYVDRDRMLRVRCYQISEQRKGQDNPLITDPYTLIEITRFLDKEMVP